MNAYRVPEIAAAVCPHQVRLDRWCPACSDADPLRPADTDRGECPACHHPDHDPGSCEWCPRCELHTDDAREWLDRIEPSGLRVPAGWVAVALLAGLALGLLIGRLA
jgi:hypothetical protein